MKTPAQIREDGIYAQASYLTDQYSREAGEAYGKWQAAEEILGETFPEMTEDEAETFMKAYYAERGWIY